MLDDYFKTTPGVKDLPCPTIEPSWLVCVNIRLMQTFHLKDQNSAQISNLEIDLQLCITNEMIVHKKSSFLFFCEKS